MAAAPEVLDAEVVAEREQEESQALVVAQQATATLFRTDDPLEIIERATRIADKLTDVLTRQNLTTRIGNKNHVNVEGWQTVGMMLGVTPCKEWVRPIPWPADEYLTGPLKKARDRGLVFGYESSFFAQTLSGQVISAAEATCKRTESKWLSSDDFAIESMAQTRATSKALASVLRWIVTLAGYPGTPAEEAGGTGADTPVVPAPQTPAPRTSADAPKASERPATPAQKGAINGRFAQAVLDGNQAAAILQWTSGVAVVDRISSKAASALIAALGKDGMGAEHILEDLRLACQSGDARALQITARYFGGEQDA